ncbi:MAG: ABC transporter permease, partial [Chloroflexota bacterium]
METQIEQRSEWSRGWRRFTANRVAVVALVFLVLLCLMAIFADVLVPYDPIEVVSGKRGEGPSLAHPLGWDHVGRDLMSRVVFGARVSLIVGLAASFISVVVGLVIGVVAGYFGGWVDAILSRLIDTLMSFPIIALLIVLSAVVGPSLLTNVAVIGLTTWARYARVVRGDVLSLKERDFITAARAVGAPEGRIIWQHIVPNLLGPVIPKGQCQQFTETGTPMLSDYGHYTDASA